jgi:hypothetical protein
MVRGRRVLIVPLALAAGWELALPGQNAGDPGTVVVVREIKTATVDGQQVEMAVLVSADGKTTEVEITREDTEENAVALEGSVLPAGDTRTPGVEAEIEEEQEVDE